MFAEDESWAGGFYYVLNVMKSLLYLPEHEKPFLVIFIANKKYRTVIEEIGYPYFEFLPLYPEVTGLKAKINFRLKRNIFGPKPYSGNTAEFVYPINYGCSFDSLRKIRRIYWIPDFQHFHYPENFSNDILSIRKQRVEEIVAKQYSIVFSSEDSRKDFVKAYPAASNKLFVLRFPSILPAADEKFIQEVKTKFMCDQPYFLCSNQFWKHKNHMIVLEALENLKHSTPNLKVVFTGNMADPGSKKYVESLTSYVHINRLEKYVSFLGFISRDEQLALLKGSLAVIQPSLFEGWSTIVEDCKAMKHFIILSDLGVHKEQIARNCFFFKSLDARDLAEKIASIQVNPQVHDQAGNYEENILSFARGILSI